MLNKSEIQFIFSLFLISAIFISPAFAINYLHEIKEEKTEIKKVIYNDNLLAITHSFNINKKKPKVHKPK